MSKLKFIIRLTITFILAGSILLLVACWVYLCALPKFISNDKVVNTIEDSIHKSTGLDVKIEQPQLKTSIKPVVGFRFKKLDVTNKGKVAASVRNFDTIVSIAGLLNQRMSVKKVDADNIYININEFLNLPQVKPKGKSKFKLDLWDAVANIKKCLIVYDVDKNTFLSLYGSDIKILNRKNEKHSKNIKFSFDTLIRKNNKTIHIKVKDNNNVFIKDDMLNINNSYLTFNNSKIFLKGFLDKHNYEIKIASNNFDIKNVVFILNSNVLANNTNKFLEPFKNIKGHFDAIFELNKKGLDGKINLKKVSLKVIALDLPVNFSNGEVHINNDEIKLQSFSGYYCESKANKFDMNGSVKDYLKSVDTNIIANALITDDFMRDHLGKVVGYPLGMTGVANTRIKFNSKNNIMDLLWLFRIKKGDNLLIDGVALSQTPIERVLKTDIHFAGQNLKIKSVDYFEGAPGRNKKPIVSVSGNIALIKNKPVLKDIGFILPQPVPSEFLNIIVRQNIFKRGNIWGRFRVYNKNAHMTVQGKLFAQKVKIPSQRLSLKQFEVLTDNNHIHIKSTGRYRRSKYEADGEIINDIKFPIVVQTANLKVENLNIEKILKTFNNSNNAHTNFTSTNEVISSKNDELEDKTADFDIRNIIIKQCLLSIEKGNYKNINFANLQADMILNKYGVLLLKSNEFDFANGRSSGQISCDLLNQKYDVILALKKVDSNLLAAELLNLNKEISGKASGILHLNTDNSLKLNGNMKFIIKNGKIGKIGLVEYLLNFASVFRNPIAMISPTTFVDLLNIPDGSFNKIVGDLDLKNNVVEKLKIKTYSSNLSAFVIGRINLEDMDSTIRVYTKLSNKHKGFYGVLRNVSLGAIADKMQLGTKSINSYYASEIEQIPKIDAEEKDCHIFVAKIDGDVEHNNFLSYLKKIK